MGSPSEMIIFTAHFHITALHRFQGNIYRCAPVVDGAPAVRIADISGPGNLGPHFFLDIQRAVTVINSYSVSLFEEILVCFHHRLGHFRMAGEYVLDGDTEHVLSGNTSTDVTYEGVAPAPIIVDFSGAMEAPRLIVTGPGSRVEEIAVDVTLDVGERLQVTTGRGQVTARLFTGGAWVDAGDMIDNVTTRPWLLRQGMQTVALSATVNTSGTARLAWHDWFPSP